MAISVAEGRKPLSDLKPAPPEFWRMWEKARFRIEGERVPLRVPDQPPMPMPIAILKLFEEGAIARAD